MRAEPTGSRRIRQSVRWSDNGISISGGRLLKHPQQLLHTFWLLRGETLLFAGILRNVEQFRFSSVSLAARYQFVVAISQ